jgi:hypothetical protein
MRDTDARLQAHLWALTLAWEVLDLTRRHREMRALELLAEESPRASFFAASAGWHLTCSGAEPTRFSCCSQRRSGQPPDADP